MESNEVANANSCLDAHVKKLGIDLLILSTLAMSEKVASSRRRKPRRAALASPENAPLVRASRLPPSPHWSGPPDCGGGAHWEEWCGGGADLGAAELAAEGRRGEGAEAAEEARRGAGREEDE